MIFSRKITAYIICENILKSNRLQEIVRLGGEHYEKTEELHADKVHGENFPL